MALLYSSLKVFNYPDHLAAFRRGELLAPVHIRLKPFNHCNHDCWYCAYRASNLQLGEEMNTKDALPADKMHEITDDIIDMGVQAVTFSGGGEPTLYKPLPEIIAKLGRAGVRIGCLSNGSNLKGRVADAFAEHGTWIRISMDGYDGKSYARARGIKRGDFDRVIDNMRRFTQGGSNCVLGVSFIIGEENHTHLAEVCALLKEVGVDHVKLSGVVVGNDPHENNLYHARIADRVTGEIEAAAELADERFKVFNHYHLLEERFERNYTSCPNIQLLPVIGADGEVYSCQDKAFTERGRLGSIKDRSFKDFWFSDEARAAVFGIDPARQCPHHCVAHQKNTAIHEFYAIDPEHGKFV